MVEGIKVGRVCFSLCILVMGILQGLSVQVRLIPHALKKVLLLDCRGKISPLVRVNYSIIIKF